MFEVSIETSFSAAHRLRNYKGNCEALHGHNWKVQVTVETAALNDIGLGIDFRELKEKTGSVLSQLDHVFLNDLGPFQEVPGRREAQLLLEAEVDARGQDGQGRANRSRSVRHPHLLVCAHRGHKRILDASIRLARLAVFFLFAPGITSSCNRTSTGVN